MKIEQIREILDPYIVELPWSGCWIYMGRLSKWGHARFLYSLCKSLGYTDTAYSMHRVIKCVLDEKEDIKGVYCHTCDIPCCINPIHVYIGTDSSNRKDFWSRSPKRFAEQARSRALGKANGIKIELQNGTKFESIREFAKYLGLHRGSTIKWNLRKGRTPDEIVEKYKRKRELLTMETRER